MTAHEHQWRFDGDDPWIICACGERRNALTGNVFQPAEASPAASGDALRLTEEWSRRWMAFTEVVVGLNLPAEQRNALIDAAHEAARSAALAASPPLPEGLDAELSSMYLAAAMQEAGFPYDTATASTILDYLQGDEGVGLARLQQPASREGAE